MIQRQNKQPGTIRAPKTHTDELSAMRHGPELHDALRKTQSSNKPTVNQPTTGSGAVELVNQHSVVRQSQSVTSPDYASTSVHVDYMLNNGAPGIVRYRWCFYCFNIMWYFLCFITM